MKLSNRQVRRKTRIELSMTSMIDVVFLLLIFFLVTTTFIRPEKQLTSAIKVNERDSNQRPSDLEPAIVDVQSVNGKVVYKLGAISTGDVQDLKSTLESFEDKSEGAFVRVADQVAFEHAAKAIGICRAAGFPSVSYIPIK